ncbi:hypothetical protein ANN_17208 [Periplaneta americana]|uniref:DUF4817 domain-containing protein n=1 Tax=Periplaneta americana TaxID=6978 RepID=A0ABQ8ST77_PERAM|nr:hypothetical protein ANN_17208 [Periplaneta americana]
MQQSILHSIAFVYNGSWTGEQCALAIKAYYKNNGSFITVQWLFRRHYNIHRNNGPISSAHAIKILIQNFEVTGSALKKSPGKQRSVRTPENINGVRVAMIRILKRSARCHAISLGLSNTGMQRILHKDLHMHPYKIQVVQILKGANKVNRMTFCQQFLDLNVNEDIVHNMLMSEEAHLHLPGYVNKQNFRYWPPTNPHEMHEEPFQCQNQIPTQGQFGSAEEVKIHATSALREVIKDGLQECFEKLYGRWQKCVTAQGAYFEGGDQGNKQTFADFIVETFFQIRVPKRSTPLLHSPCKYQELLHQVTETSTTTTTTTTIKGPHDPFQLQIYLNTTRGALSSAIRSTPVQSYNGVKFSTHLRDTKMRKCIPAVERIAVASRKIWRDQMKMHHVPEILNTVRFPAGSEIFMKNFYLGTRRDGDAQHLITRLCTNMPGLNPKSLRSVYEEKAYVTVDSDSSVGWGLLTEDRHPRELVMEKINVKQNVPSESVSKRQRMESQKIEAKEVCDRIIQETTYRFQSLNYLDATKLLNSKFFDNFSHYFPESKLEVAVNSYTVLNKRVLKTQLGVI